MLIKVNSRVWLPWQRQPSEELGQERSALGLDVLFLRALYSLCHETDSHPYIPLNIGHPPLSLHRKCILAIGSNEAGRLVLFQIAIKI